MSVPLIAKLAALLARPDISADPAILAYWLEPRNSEPTSETSIPARSGAFLTTSLMTIVMGFAAVVIAAGPLVGITLSSNPSMAQTAPAPTLTVSLFPVMATCEPGATTIAQLLRSETLPWPEIIALIWPLVSVSRGSDGPNDSAMETV